MRTSIFPLADKRHYDNQRVIDHIVCNTCTDFDGGSLTSYISFLTELQFELTTRNPGKQLAIRFEPEDDDLNSKASLCIEVFHIESDEERDARLDKIEGLALEFYIKHSNDTNLL